MGKGLLSIQTGLRKKEINDYKVYVLWVVGFFLLAQNTQETA